MRLQKFLAMGAANSRRKAEQLISSGMVTVNGRVARLGMRIDPNGDAVSVAGATAQGIRPSGRNSPLVLLMNKPRGYVCSHRDAYNPETIFSLVPKEFRSRKLMFCGRLDRETEGMVLITDDGNFAQRVTHPSGGVRKHYEVTLTAPLPNAAARQLLGGVNCGGEFLKFDRLVPIGRGTMKNLAFEVVLSQGRKNEIHRALEHFGIFVKRLKRTRMGGLRLRGVAPGRCRPLEHGEIDALFRGSTPVANALPPVPRSPSANGADPSGGRLDGHSPGGCAAKVSAGAPVAKFLPIAGGLRGGRDFLVANGKYGKRFSGNR